MKRWRNAWLYGGRAIGPGAGGVIFMLPRRGPRCLSLLGPTRKARKRAQLAKQADTTVILINRFEPF